MLAGRTCVVAGNGHSLTTLAPGRVLATDAILRTNNFFFERAFYLGRRVDLAYIAGDPRVAPFMFETLHQCRDDYDIRAWTSHNPRVIRAGMRRFGDLYRPIRFRDAAIKAEVARLMERYQRKPMSGTYAVLAAHGMGAEHILLAGMDLYTGGPRYPFTPGPHFQTLMAPGMAAMGPDTHLHDPDLDRAIFELLAARDDLELERTTDRSALDGVLPLAPVREGPPVEVLPRPDAVNDWVSWAGPYPIALLKLLRRGAALRRRLLGRGSST